MEKLNINLKDSIKDVLKDVLLEKVSIEENDTIFNFHIESNKLLDTSIINMLEDSIERDLLSGNQKANVIIKYNINFENIGGSKEIYEYIKSNLRLNISKDNMMYGSIYDNAEIIVDDNYNIKISVAKNFTLKYIYEGLSIYVKDMLLKLYNLNYNVSIDENDDIKEKILNDKKLSDQKYYEEINRRLQRSIDQKNNDIYNKENEIENDDAIDVKTNGKKKRRNLQQFNDDGSPYIFGKPIKSAVNITEFSTIVNEIREVYIEGVIFAIDIKKGLKSKRKEGATFNIVNFYITDGRNAIKANIYANTLDDVIKAENTLKIGARVIIFCDIKKNMYDRDELEAIPKSIKVIGKVDFILNKKSGAVNFLTDRVDEEKNKRVELHLHTKYSENDAVGSIEAYIDTAHKFGMKAIAITDHGNVQALPVAENYIKNKSKKDKSYEDIKLLLGVEAYLVDDAKKLYMDHNFNESKESFNIDDRFYVLDVYTTNDNYKSGEIKEYNITAIEGKNIISNKKIVLSNNNDFKNATIELIDYMTSEGKDFTLVNFDTEKNWRFILEKAKYLNDEILNKYLDKVNKIFDIYNMSKILIDRDAWHRRNKERSFVSKYYKVDKYVSKISSDKNEKEVLFHSNEVTSRIFISMIIDLSANFHINDLAKINTDFNIDRKYIKRSNYYHIILIAKNDVGRVNLYKLVSDSFTTYLGKKPLMPRSIIDKYREGLIIGSACSMGELYDSLINGYDDDYLKNKAKYYDYLEIQPLSNNLYLTERAEYKNIYKDIDDIKLLNMKILEIGRNLSKMVVAASDCHFVNKEDKIFRDILKYSVWHKKTNLDENNQIKENVEVEEEAGGDLYFRNTDEMLKEYEYLGHDEAYELVVTNTNKIADMCEKISSLRPDKCPPIIENSDNELKDACMNNAHKIYGENLPKIIEDRLDKELHLIIDNGYSVLYISAKRLIDDSMEHGYPVGSRGSVGSSLVANMIGISEVNPLPPHYVCDNCHHVEIDTEYTKKYDNMSGFDMPDKICPKCGKLLRKDGVNIPFEIFLGVDGKVKEPDIDLNFSDEYQSESHNKTKELFGDDHTFKAGTVNTVASETSIAYVRKYNELNGITFTRADLEYQKMGITDCKRSTGQHPGGMVVLPPNEYIYTFTPINYPANKESEGVTTQFEYHEIENNLLKLDMLGQNMPTIFKKLKDLTGVDPRTVPFYEDKVLSLFQGLDALGIEPIDIHGEKTGCLTVPEFGTINTMKMCMEAKPKNVSDLIRISGLSHGTDVWEGNIRDVVLDPNNGITLEKCMCCRDDIMLYLISKGLDYITSFSIMEFVRKNKKGDALRPDWEEKMRDRGVPDWYIDCCKKIKYMFPKAHAAAYVITALRIAYYKIHYPLEYYTVFFSAKNRYFDYDLMCGDLDTIRRNLDTLLKNNNESGDADYNDEEDRSDDLDDNYDDSEKTSNQEKKEKESIRQLKICEECLARGIQFTDIDIYKAKPFDFTIVDGKIMPALVTIKGLGRTKVERFYEEANKMPFNSIEDLKKRGGIDDTLIERLVSIGAVPKLKDKYKISVTDFL